MGDSTTAKSSISIPTGWDWDELGSLVDSDRGISYGIVQPGSHDPEGIPIVRVNNIKGGSIDRAEALRVSPDVEAKYERTRLRGGEVLLSLVGTLGECAIVPPTMKGWNVARAVAVIPVVPEIDPRWIAYCLRSVEVQRAMGAWATTTVQATLNLRDVRRLPILLAPQQLRSAITNLLGSLDDKIEQNRRTARTLEQLARAIFKAWFVNFEPVKAKAAGAASFPSMPQPTFDALPTTFTTTDHGPVPEGWEAGSLGDIIDIHDSRRVPLSKRQREERRGSFRYYGAAGIIDYVDGHLFDGCFTLVGEDGTVFGDGSRPMTQYVWGQFWVNNHAHVITGSGPWTTEHIYILLQNVNIRPFVTGAVQPKLNQGNLKSVPVVVPQDDVVRSFGEVIEPLFQILRHVNDENTKLARMRDYLLPQLLSGQVRAKEVVRD